MSLGLTGIGWIVFLGIMSIVLIGLPFLGFDTGFTLLLGGGLTLGGFYVWLSNNFDVKFSKKKKG